MAVAMRDLVIAMFLMTGVVTGMTAFYLDLATQTKDPTVPNVNIDNIPDAFNLIDEADSIVNNTDPLYNFVAGIPILGDIAALTIKGMNILQVTLAIPGYFINMMNYFVGVFALDPWIVDIVQGVIATILIFTLISALVKWRV